MHNVQKWSDTQNGLTAGAECFLKCVGPFWDIMHKKASLKMTQQDKNWKHKKNKQKEN